MSKERLTDNFKQLVACGPKTCGDICETHELSCKYCVVQQAFNKLAEYEDLEEQGLLLRLPCKVGDTFYELNECTEPPYAYPRIAHNLQHCVYALERLGKTTFLTQAEAEEKLRELEGK